MKRTLWNALLALFGLLLLSGCWAWPATAYPDTLEHRVPNTRLEAEIWLMSRVKSELDRRKVHLSPEGKREVQSIIESGARVLAEDDFRPASIRTAEDNSKKLAGILADQGGETIEAAEVRASLEWICKWIGPVYPFVECSERRK